jgi:carboxypeptidase PM20D1
MLKKTLLLLLLAILLVVGIVLFKTFQFTSIQTKVAALPAPAIPETSLQHFQQAIAIKTISFGNPALFDSTQFLAFRKFLENTYPKMHEKLTREIVLGYSLLYKWEGKNTSLKPVVLMAHQDVVPIEEATQSMWTSDPFAGTVKDNFIWGRGTTDDKINLVSICESVEKLVIENFQPERTVYLVFGHDEELGGKGAVAIAQLMKQRNIVAEMVMDEGGIITKEKIPGMKEPVALVGTSEKGYLSIELVVEIPGGHSSMPEKETAIDILTKAIVTLRSHPFEPQFSVPMQGFIKSLGPEMPFVQKMAFANPWLFKGLIIGTYDKSAPGSAMLRTTIAPTIINAGIKDNVIPTQAKATVNFRLLPGDLSEDVIDRVKKIIDNDHVKISRLDAGAMAEASAVTPMDGYGYQKVETTIKKSYPNLLSSPFLMLGATDSRHFGEVSDNIVKFSPMIDPIGFHGIDERVSLESYQTALWFYEQLLKDLN